LDKINYKYQYFTKGRVCKEVDDGGFFSERMNNETDVNLFLDRLQEPQKTIVRMEMDGYSNQEISEALKISSNSIYSHKKRAKLLFLAFFN
jgi:DNA-directed RNA polymerase specialized sigma24 family protein